MQDPKMFQNPIQFPEQEQLKCPRCDSSNTKFCYYNNYNLSQPRHFCKNCKRYWTKGGSLRNIPIGGRTRKTPKKKSSSSTPTTHSAVSEGQKVDQEQNLMVDMSGGSFSSVLGTNEQFGSAYIEEGSNANGSDLKLMQMGEDQFGENVMENGINNGDSYMSLQSGDDWDGNSGCSWPDLAI